MKITKNEKFLCFSADGEPHIRYLKEIHLDPSCTPDLILENRDISASPYSCLRSCSIDYAPFDLSEIIPLNKEARTLVAKLLWKKSESEFKSWRSRYRFRFPSLKGYYSDISKVIK